MKNRCLRKMFAAFVLLFLLSVSATNIHSQNMFRKVNDFDGDGRADYAVTRNENGSKVWYVLQSTGGFKAFQFGLDTDQDSPGDYDGDGKTDFAIYRKVSNVPCCGIHHQFWIHQSQTETLAGKSFSTSGNSFIGKLIQQDYNGDGQTDPALTIEQETPPYIWYLTPPTSPRIFYPAGDTPVRVGDLTGDQKADGVSYRPSDNLITIKNSTSGAIQNLYFGTAGDQFVPADFDGDGIGDLTIFRESKGTWWWIRSSDGAIQAVQWGSPGDIPVPADYDGDGKTDLAIWRSGFYWILGSQNGISVVNWGLSTDTLVTY